MRDRKLHDQVELRHPPCAQSGSRPFVKGKLRSRHGVCFRLGEMTALHKAVNLQCKIRVSARLGGLASKCFLEFKEGRNEC